MWRTSALLAVAGLLSAAPGAGAAVTIGSDLTRVPATSDACAAQPTCTFVQSSLPGNGLALIAPANGVITRWRVKTAAGPAGSVRLHVLRPDPGGQYAPVSTSATHTTVAAGGVQVFDARQPIAAGDVIGLDLDQTAVPLALDAPGAEGLYWEPRPGATPKPPSGSDDDVELLFNADVEGDADGDGYGDETQDGCPTEATVQVTGCPVDLAVSYSLAPARVDAGADVTATVVIRNLGRYPANHVQLNWQFAQRPNVLTGASSACRPPNSGCDLGSLPAGESTTLTAQGHEPAPPSGGVFEHQQATSAEAHSANLDTDLTNNRAETSWTINGSPLVIPPPRALPHVDRRAPRITLRLARQTLGKVLAKGLRVNASCDESCRGTLRVLVGRRELGRASWQTAAALRVKLARKVLGRRRRATLTVTATATDAAGNAARAVSRSITVKR